MLLFALIISIGQVSAIEDNACTDFEDSQMSEGSSLDALSPSNSEDSDLIAVSNEDSNLMSDLEEDSELISDSSEELLSESEGTFIRVRIR